MMTMRQTMGSNPSRLLSLKQTSQRGSSKCDEHDAVYMREEKLKRSQLCRQALLVVSAGEVTEGALADFDCH